MAGLRYKTSSCKPNKYNAKRVTIDGHTFHSIKESKRYQELKLLYVAGHIDELELQPKIPLIVNGTKIGSYVGDFRYKKNGVTILEDVKSKATITPVYRLKKKILATYDPPVHITEVL
jgi:hypothetical protein